MKRRKKRNKLISSKKRKWIHTKKSRKRVVPSQVKVVSSQVVKSEYDIGFDNGYNAGHLAAIQSIDKELNKDYDEGFQQGIYTGGDKIVDELLPGDVILPEVSVQQIIELGLHQLQHQYHRLLASTEVAKEIQSSLQHKTPLSIIRIGDGELLTLAQECVLPIDEVKKKGPFLEYAGVQIPDLKARDLLAESIVKASIIGVPKLRVPNFLPLMFPVFQAHGIDYKKLKLTYSTINYVLFTDGLLPRLLSGRRILVIGNRAKQLSVFFNKHGIETAEPVSEVHGINDIPYVMNEVAKRNFELALVSAGIAAAIIAQRIASELGKTAIDFGHLADSLIDGEAVWK